jgi:hypothetical protein
MDHILPRERRLVAVQQSTTLNRLKQTTQVPCDLRDMGGAQRGSVCTDPRCGAGDGKGVRAGGAGVWPVAEDVLDDTGVRETDD